MKKYLALIPAILCLCLIQHISAQNLPALEGKEPVSLTPDELFVLSMVPELKLPEIYKGPNAPLLPVSVDNSTQPYFRSITWQSGYECGQSAGIAFNFTYEIDRLRNLPASALANQYPTHFSWDFFNNANNYQGVSFFDTWEVTKVCGNMNVVDYGGGLNTGGFLRWISGYDKYYNGMKNRLNYVRAIRVDNPEGLLTLKYWLLDHLENASVGGVANFYAKYFGSIATVLPAGTPEAGKYVQPAWDPNPSHAWTVCGYNDSIRWDYNGDGQYTNTIDINGDGIVDMHDWEKGGLKFANGYAGNGWCNSGFCYLMYKTLADNMGSGGIWNHTVYVLDVKQTCDPKLTMKITLKHNSRNKLKVTAGINTDLLALSPSYTKEYPIFNFQGGDQFMQGGTTEADKTIEFGLDLVPLLNQINPGQQAKYFLQVKEVDPTGSATGEIVNWALIDYTSGTPVTINYPFTNTPILNNTTTLVSQIHAVNFTKPTITTNSLPPAPLNQPYSHTLTASGGTPPYLWDAQLTYPESINTSAFPAITSQALTLTNNNTGYAIKTIDFSFPYYKRSINKLYIYADGYILFDDQPYTWPYLIDKNLLFKQTAILAPFMTDMTVYPSLGQGVWYEGNANYATIRWKASITGMAGTATLNFAVKLYASGMIEYYYGDMQYPVSTVWTGGISSGDNKSYQYSLLNGAGSIPANKVDQFTSCGFPVEMQITEDGQFMGTPTHSYSNLPIKFEVTDNNNISSTKVLLFNTYGLLINYTINSGGDNIIEYGETANISVTLNNIGTQAYHNIYMVVRVADPYITLVDSTQSVLLVNGGQTLTIPNAFSFTVAPDVPDDHDFQLTLFFTSQEQNFSQSIDLVAFAPVFHMTKINLMDGDNGRLDPGESTDMITTFTNTGGAKASGINLLLSTLDTNLTIDVNSGSIPVLKPDSSAPLTFHLTANGAAPFEYLYRMNAAITASNNWSSSDSLFLFSGDIIEDYETGDFNKFSWYPSGNGSWMIIQDNQYEGANCSRSGWITDNMETGLNLNVNVLEDGELSFWKYVSCELDPSGGKNFDYMAFLVDNLELCRWDGGIEWSKETFMLTKGYHILTWIYHKDGSISSGYDCCFLDFITFPLIGNAIPKLAVSPLNFTITVEKGETAKDTLYLTNSGGGKLDFSVIVFDTAVNKTLGSPDHVGDSYIECLTQEFVPGQPFAWGLRVHNLGNDNEYLKEIKIDLPQGMIVDAATNFAGGSLGELAFLGTPGNGTTLQWHGESTGARGVIKPGETAVASISGTIGEPFTNDVFMVYDIRGDSLGELPHHQAGHVKVTNSGLGNGWLSLAPQTGSMLRYETDLVTLTANAESLTPGTYSCNIVARDLYNNKTIIPVTLNVTWPVSNEPGSQSNDLVWLGNFPNPFSASTLIRFKLERSNNVNIDLYTIHGSRIRALENATMQAGEHSLVWDGKDDMGNSVPPGIYTCRVKTGDFRGSFKLIRIR